MSKPSADDALNDPAEDLWASPESGATTQKHTPSSNTSSAHKQPSSRHDPSEARDTALRAELERVKEINRVIENVTASLTKAKDNMHTVHRTVASASTLLATWTRILSQTEHNQRLILNPNWHGATQDVEDAENEGVLRQQEAERRVAEEQRRREEVARRAEEEERRRAVGTPTARGSGKGRGRGARGSSSTGAGYVGVGGQTGRGRGSSVSRPGSGIGIGRGVGGTRGRGRGLG